MGGQRRLPTVSRRSATPLWQQVRDDLRLRIDAGEFPTAFPGEHELGRQYGVSRHTVREALRELRDAGLVTASRGHQPRLIGDAVIEQPLGALYSLFASVERAGLEQHSEVLRLEARADAHVAVRLGLEESAPLLYIERLRIAGGEPLAHDKLWLPAERTTPLLSVDFTNTSVYRELARLCGIALTGGREVVRAVVPATAERQLLAVGPGEAAFAIDRTGCIGPQPIEWRTTVIRGDRFAVVADFDAHAGYRMGAAAVSIGSPAGAAFS